MRYRFFLLLLLFLAVSLPLAARAKPQVFDYQHCAALSNGQASEALKYAKTWLAKSKNDAFALHCEALGLYGSGAFRDAAGKLENVAEHPSLPDAMRSQIWEQAEQAWLKASDPARAEVALSMAIEAADRYQQKDAEGRLLLRKTKALVAKQQWLDALQTLDQAAIAAPQSADFSPLRTQVMGQLNRPAITKEDGKKAVSQKP